MFVSLQDLFDNMDKWEEKHKVLNDSCNFLIEVVREPIANELKQQLLLINRRWKDLSDQAKAFLSVSIDYSGLPRHRENREFESPFFQTGKTQGIC